MDIANHFNLLEMIEHPAFCVRDNIIVRANRAASQKLFEEGKSILPFLREDRSAYEAFDGGCLYLRVTSADVTIGASVTRIDDFDLFVVDTEGAKLEAFALAALQLKMPMCNIVNLIEELIVGDKQYEKRSGSLRQNVYQLSRIIGNMSDADWLRNDSSAQMEMTDFQYLFAELMEKMDIMVSAAGCKLEFTNITESVSGMADRELLDRAISNILSNAIKFSPPKNTIRVELTRKEEYLYFTVSDPGDSHMARCNVFTRYMRTAGIEDKRHGLGLGMQIVHSVAIDHGGTVLVDTPPEGGTRVTMSISLRKPKHPILRSPVCVPKVDWDANLDPMYLEFADVLPSSAFKDMNK